MNFFMVAILARRLFGRYELKCANHENVHGLSDKIPLKYGLILFALYERSNRTLKALHFATRKSVAAGLPPSGIGKIVSDANRGRVQRRRVCRA
jgi:hypothetical protein